MTPRGFGTSFLRLFAVQASWNYERMLGLGVGVAEEPLLRDLPGGISGPAYHDAVARGGRFFNAHPYLCGLVVGAAARAEHDGVSAEQVARLRAALAGPLGALGDRLVWAGWLPLLSTLALAAVALGAKWPAVALFLLVYNVGHVALRWWGLKAGWRHGARVALALHEPALQRAVAVMGPAMALAAGLALPLVALYLAAPFHGGARVGLAATAAGAFALLQLRPSQLSGLRLGLVLVAVALLVGVVWP